MYGHGNNSSQFQQQTPGPPPPPPSHFQQAPLPPPPPPHYLMQQGSMPVYHHAPPHPLSQQGGFQAHGGILGVGQSYSRPLPHLYPSGANQNLYHNPPGPPIWPPPPPPPVASSYSSTPKNESVIHMPSIDVSPPPPLTTSPPPLPTSPPPHSLFPPPPPPAFPLPSSGTVDVASSSPSISSSDNPTESHLIVSNSIYKPACHNSGSTTMSDGNVKITSGSSGKVSVILNLPPPPPRPMDEKNAPSTETLSNVIAKIDPDSKSIACQSESGNEEFDFLNGGDLENESSIHTSSLKDASASHSPADSDMEMEDDITQFDKDQGDYLSFEYDMLGVDLDELNVKQQIIRSKTPPVNRKVKNDSCRDVSGFGTCGLAEQGSGGVGKYYGQHNKDGSPFRLLQDYASDDDSDANYDEPCLENASTVKVSSPIKDQLFCLEPLMIVKKTVLKSIIRLKTDDQVGERKKHIRHSSSQDNVQDRDDDLEVGNVDHVRKSGETQKEDRKCASTQQKVDEFGRLVRKGANDSDSDDVGHRRTRHKRDRSWSRSISPHDRRRRKSPLRRRERRNRSRSRSPEKRNRRSKSPFNKRVGDHGYEKMRWDKRSRSHSQSPEKRKRSKSPINRRVSDYGGEKMWRDKRHMPECLDHLRGKCLRRSSCRFRHNDSEKTSESRSKNKQHYQEASPSLNYPEVQELQIRQEYKKDVNINEKCMDGLQSAISDQEGQLLKTDAEKPEIQAESISHLNDNDNFQQLEGANQPLVIIMARSQTAVTEAGTIKSPENITSLKSPTHCSTNDTLLDQISTTYPDNLPISEPQFNHNPPSHLPPPPIFSHGVNALHIPQLPTGVRIPYPPPLLNTQPQFSGLPNFNWSSLPPPPLSAIHGAPHFQTNHVPSRNEFSSQTFFRPCQPGLPTYSQVAEFQHQHPSGQEPYGSKHLSMGHPLQPFAGLGLIRGNIPSAQRPFLQQQPLPPYGLQQHSAVDNNGSAPLGMSVNTMSSANQRFPTNNTEMNQLSLLSDCPGSRIATHYNPYASTFDQPLSSQFSSSAFRPEKSGDQYDPVFDSIEISLGKNDLVKKWDHINDTADFMLRLSETHKPSDVEKNNNNDEYGEMADAEVGAVENGSFSSPLDIENTAGGEVEIDEIKSRKKSKDSKSMKLFRVALANFVKEVLKPSWRQGNMSKEAFKTIVKKTVDKASAAMKGHQIPKSQAKIDHYINSSQRKLTKLVMGYVDKYVKA